MLSTRRMVGMTFPSIKSTAVLVLVALLALWPLSVRADDPRASQLTVERWSKLCADRSLCFVGLGARGACMPSGGRMAIHVVNGKAAKLAVNFGTKRKLEGDIRVQVDQEQPMHIPVRECYPAGCRGELDIDDDFIEHLKRSRIITIEATTTAHRRLTFSFPLAGFARAYDGPAIETPVFEELQDKLKAEMRQRAAQIPPPLPACED